MGAQPTGNTETGLTTPPLARHRCPHQRRLLGDRPMEHLEGDGDDEGVVEEREDGMDEDESSHAHRDDLNITRGKGGAQCEGEVEVVQRRWRLRFREAQIFAPSGDVEDEVHLRRSRLAGGPKKG
mgnify:CR=1 FL=1